MLVFLIFMLSLISGLMAVPRFWAHVGLSAFSPRLGLSSSSLNTQLEILCLCTSLRTSHCTMYYSQNMDLCALVVRMLRYKRNTMLQERSSRSPRHAVRGLYDLVYHLSASEPAKSTFRPHIHPNPSSVCRLHDPSHASQPCAFLTDAHGFGGCQLRCAPSLK